MMKILIIIGMFAVYQLLAAITVRLFGMSAQGDRLNTPSLVLGLVCFGVWLAWYL